MKFDFQLKTSMSQWWTMMLYIKKAYLMQRKQNITGVGLIQDPLTKAPSHLLLLSVIVGWVLKQSLEFNKTICSRRIVLMWLLLIVPQMLFKGVGVVSYYSRLLGGSTGHGYSLFQYDCNDPQNISTQTRKFKTVIYKGQCFNLIWCVFTRCSQIHHSCCGHCCLPHYLAKSNKVFLVSKLKLDTVLMN